MARVLLTNDDGTPSEGLWALARAVHAAGHDVVVVAPIDERSGAGAAIGHILPGQPIPCARVERADLPGVDCWAVAGPPALCTLLALRGAFGPAPELVCSGINPGWNSGYGVLHSGTVGATLTAANQGVSGVAVSIGFIVPQGLGPAGTVGAVPFSTEGYHWDTAAALAVEALAQVADLPAGSVANLNVPNVELADVRGIEAAPLAAYPTLIAQPVAGPAGGGITIEMASPPSPPAEASDSALQIEGYATLTLLVPPRALPGADALVPRLVALVEEARS